MPRRTVTGRSLEFTKETTCMAGRGGVRGDVAGITTETVATIGPPRTTRTGFFCLSEKATTSSGPWTDRSLSKRRSGLAAVGGFLPRTTRTECLRGSAKRTVSVVPAPVRRKILICAAMARGDPGFEAGGEASACPISASPATIAIMRSVVEHLMRELVQEGGFAVKQPDRPCQPNRCSASIAKPAFPFEGHSRTARCRKS